jgi:hypothetical protein
VRRPAKRLRQETRVREGDYEHDEQEVEGQRRRGEQGEWEENWDIPA